MGSFTRPGWLLVVGLAAGGCTERPSQIDSLLGENAAAFKAARDAVCSDIEAVAKLSERERDRSHPLTGYYFSGDNTDDPRTSIHVGSNSNVVYYSHGCMGVYEANYGEFQSTGRHRFDIKWSIDPTRSGSQVNFTTMYRVRWGKRQYMVPDEKMKWVVANYNHGGAQREQLWGAPIRFLDKNLVLDEERDQPGPSGGPDFPEEFAKLVIEKPVRMTVLSDVDESKLRGESGYSNFDMVVEVDAGSKNGLFPGSFVRWEEEGARVTLEIKEVGESTSKALLSGYMQETTHLPKVFFLPGAKP